MASYVYLEDGTSKLLLESGDAYLLEQNVDPAAGDRRVSEGGSVRTTEGSSTRIAEIDAAPFVMAVLMASYRHRR